LVEHQQGKKKARTILSIGLGWYLTHPLNEEALQNYCIETLRLQNPKILIKDIPYNTIISMDSYPLRILAKTGTSLKVANTIQPIFSAELEPVIKEMFFQINKETVEDEQAVVGEEFIKADFLRLYDAFIEKLGNPPFSRLSAYANQASNIKQGRQKFRELTVKEQAKVLNQVLTLFLCDSRLSDISLISPLKNGKPQNTQVGMIRIPQSLPTGVKKISICYQSVTGLFEKWVKVS